MKHIAHNKRKQEKIYNVDGITLFFKEGERICIYLFIRHKLNNQIIIIFILRIISIKSF